jgi:hypothetical protein
MERAKIKINPRKGFIKQWFGKQILYIRKLTNKAEVLYKQTIRKAKIRIRQY